MSSLVQLSLLLPASKQASLLRFLTKAQRRGVARAPFQVGKNVANDTGAGIFKTQADGLAALETSSRVMEPYASAKARFDVIGGPTDWLGRLPGMQGFQKSRQVATGVPAQAAIDRYAKHTRLARWKRTDPKFKDKYTPEYEQRLQSVMERLNQKALRAFNTMQSVRRDRLILGLAVPAGAGIATGVLGPSWAMPAEYLADIWNNRHRLPDYVRELHARGSDAYKRVNDTYHETVAPKAQEWLEAAYRKLKERQLFH